MKNQTIENTGYASRFGYLTIRQKSMQKIYTRAKKSKKQDKRYEINNNIEL